MDLVETGKKITDFFNNIKILITGFFDFLPSEIKIPLISVLIIVCIVFLYRFIR